MQQRPAPPHCRSAAVCPRYHGGSGSGENRVCAAGQRAACRAAMDPENMDAGASAVPMKPAGCRGRCPRKGFAGHLYGAPWKFPFRERKIRFFFSSKYDIFPNTGNFRCDSFFCYILPYKPAGRLLSLPGPDGPRNHRRNGFIRTDRAGKQTALLRAGHEGEK